MRGSRYIRWAKSRERFRYNLGRSSIRPCPPADLAVRPEDIAIAADNAHGWGPLRHILGERYGVAADRVVLAVGTSMANHLACAAILEFPGHVLVESPGYEPLAALPAYFGADVESFPRHRAADWALDVDEIAARVRPGVTQLVILSDLHNPTGQRAAPRALDALAELADQHGFHVLVDEVYLEFTADRGIAATRSPRFISTCSLTKAYGLDGLRAGWIIASEVLAEQLRALNDLFGIIMPHPSERLAARAFERLDTIAAGVRRLVTANRELAVNFVEQRPELNWVAPEIGPVGFVQLAGGRVDDLIGLLEREYDTTAPPGSFFGADDHFRLAFGMERADLVAGLARLGAALDQM
jgi:aspartate/methionine/tyrosine aminotransferase